MTSDNWVTVTEADEVTDEILEAAQEVYNGWFAKGSRINWVDFLDRLDGIPLEGGGKLNLAGSLVSPAIKRIQAHIREYAKL